MSLFETIPDMKYSFGGHETFPFRYGWLKKGVDQFKKNPSLFRQEDALVILGVGKNMVRSIRHWCLATQLIKEEVNAANTRIKELKLTPLAENIFNDNNGWDPYLENPASLWLLHWNLVSNTTKATAWRLCFTFYPQLEFTKDKLLNFVKNKLGHYSSKVSQSTLERDIDCMIKTYFNSKINLSNFNEEKMHCPLSELGLIKIMPDTHTYYFLVGPKPSLPAAIVGFALVDYFDKFKGRQTFSLEDCLYAPGSPGQAFKLDEFSMIEYLEEIQKITDGCLRMDETAGLKQIYKDGSIDGLELLKQYYE